MISVSNLCKQFGGNTVVNNLSFELAQGDVLAFLGPNGAGKSTTMKMLTGFLPASSGVMTINGLDYNEPGQGIKIKQMIGYLPEGAPAYADMTVYQFLDFIAQARKIPKKIRKQAINKVCEQVELKSVLNKKVETLSKGFTRRVGLAQAIIHDPKILILDEPTDGLDPNQKHQVRQLIANLAKDKIVIISTHILEEVTAVCNRVIIIANGEKRFDDTPQTLQQQSAYHNAVTIKLSYLADISGLLEVEGVADLKHDKASSRVTIFPEPGVSIIENVSAHIQRTQMPVDMIFPEKGRLDEVFRSITKSEQKKEVE
ncbi:ABC transporter ATP-binding protein [Glaciecola sp. 2405UD65-10]|uniref:ABC transporter ATP-binding protein n=1 Tax=Glaciecola sp. 2405UD65-10 TaxID=3397244 RepID=UPI003B5AB2CE